MCEWTTKPLKDVAEILSSNVDKKSNPGEQPVRLCNYMDVYSHEYITKSIAFMEATATSAEIDRFGIERGDVMITKDSETPDDIGISSVVIDEIPNLVCGYHVALIKPNRTEIEPIYLAKQLSTVDSSRYFGRLANGSTRYGLAYGAIANTPIRWAPLAQQQRITEILSTVDEAIEQTEALIAKTQQIKAGLMHDLFTRGVTKSGQLRPPREEAPHLYKESPLGWIPKEWQAAPLRSVCVYQHGRPFPSSEYGDEGVLLLRPGNLHVSGFVKFDAPHTTMLPEQWISDAQDYLLNVGDIVMNLTAQSLEDEFLGRVCLLEEGQPSLLNQRIARFVSVGIRHEFLYWLLRSCQFRWQINRTTQGTKVQHLYNSDLNRVIFFIPAESQEQELIANQLFAITTKIRDEELFLDKCKKNKQGLMNDLLTGRVRAKTESVPPTESAHV